MSSIPEGTDNGRKDRDDDFVADTVKLVGVIAVMVYGMYFAWNFVGPSGQTMSIGSLIALFFREMFLVGFFGLALIVGCFVWLLRRVFRLFRRGDDAP